jgi:hypothetical protein
MRCISSAAGWIDAMILLLFFQPSMLCPQKLNTCLLRLPIPVPEELINLLKVLLSRFRYLPLSRDVTPMDGVWQDALLYFETWFQSSVITAASQLLFN